MNFILLGHVSNSFTPTSGLGYHDPAIVSDDRVRQRNEPMGTLHTNYVAVRYYQEKGRSRGWSKSVLGLYHDFVTASNP